MPGGYVGGRPKDTSKLSTDPAQMRRRLRRKGRHLQQDIDLYVENTHHKPIEEWDLEELARGRPRDKGGSFRGPAPKWLTQAVSVEVKKRLLTETIGKLGGHLDTAITALGDLLKSEEVDDNGKPVVDARTKLAAATFIIEHIVGKPTAVIDIHATGDFTRGAIASAIVLDDGMPQGHLTLEGEIVEDDDMEEMDDDDGN